MYWRSEKNLLNTNISSTCPHNMVNFGPLTVEIDRWVWGTPANLNGFHILASLLHQRCSMEVNQTLHDVWPSPGLVDCIHFRGLYPLMEVCLVQNSLCVQVLRSAILAACTALEQWASAKLRCGIFMQQGSHPVRHWAVELSRFVLYSCRCCRQQNWVAGAFLHPPVCPDSCREISPDVVHC